MHIASVEKLPLTTTGSPLQIRCKTFLSVTFVIPRERDCHEVFGTLQKLSQPGMAHIIIIALIMYEVLYMYGSVRHESNLIIVPQDATYSVYYISVGSSTCFGC